MPALCLVLFLLGAQTLHVWATPAEAATPLTEMQQERSSDEPGDRYFGEFTVEGEVRRKPSTIDGSGSWLLRSDSGIYYWAYADNETVFQPAMPNVGERVKIRGRWEWYIDRFWFVATQIEGQTNGNPSSDGKLEGILVAAPATGTGTWVLQTGLTNTVGILVDGETRLDDGARGGGGCYLDRPDRGALPVPPCAAARRDLPDATAYPPAPAA
ncbi:MAG: hypothetical protein KDE19_12225, partial [Caldilineaceae bacterium]|nr:hypothetical protein [Caldilineaceae bacterium]